MKKILSLLSLAALTVGLLGSCAKIDERISNLEKRVDGIESTSIASVQQQINGIKASITELEAADVTIGGKIDELKATAETHQTLIDALKEADETLGQKDTELEGRIATLEGQVTTINGQIKTLEDADKAINIRIDELRSYVDTGLVHAKDWAEATFATLEQYQQTADDLAALSVTVTGISTTLTGIQTSIAGLDTRIDSLDTALQGRITTAKTELEGMIADLKTELEGRIADAITASETSIKTWINELLEGYYTAAKVDEKINALKTAIEAIAGPGAVGTDSLATELTALKTAVDTAKAAIRTEYRNAIDEAINKLDGEIRGALLDSILAVNGRADALGTRVTTLEGKVLALEGNVDKLLAMIQSVTILPAYTNGSVEAKDSTLTIDFVVSPAAAVKGVTKDSIKVLVHEAKVKTKAASYTTIPVASATVDETTGDVTITADISKITPAEGNGLTVAVNIKNGISHFTTEFVPVENILTISAILPEGFPMAIEKDSIPKSAWTSIAAGQKCYLSFDESKLLFYNENGTPDKEFGVSTDKVVLEDNGNYVCTVGSSVTITFNMLDGALSNIQFADTISTTWDGYYQESACVAAGTMITMGNGERKAVENLEVGDVIRTFDHETGEVSSSTICFISKSRSAVNAFTLTFEGGIEVCVIEEHGFYDLKEQKYAFINPRNAKDYIGHQFYNADTGGCLELKSCEIQRGSVDAYAVITSRHLNHTANGMLSMCDGTVKIFANLFEFDDEMKFDADKKNHDIKEYGLTPKEKVLEFEGFIESDYYDYNLQYLNIAVGKGLTSWELIEALSDYYVANGIF